MLRTILAEASGKDSLVLEHRFISQADTDEICKFISVSALSLQILRLRNCRIDRHCIVQILTRLNRHVEDFLVLDLSYTNVEGFVVEIFRFISSTETLKELYLTCCGLSSETLHDVFSGALLQLLAQHPGLQRVHLLKNRLGVKMGAAILDVMQTNARIVDLRLAGTGVGISNLGKIAEILTRNILLKYPPLTETELPVIDRHGGVFSEEATVEFITQRREAFLEKQDERSRLAKRYEASVLHDMWLTERSREKFMTMKKDFLASEQENLRAINEKIHSLKTSEFPRRKRVLETLTKEEAAATARLAKFEQKEVVKEAEEALKEAKEKRREEMKIQDEDQEKMLDWVIQQDLKTIEAIEKEIADIKRRMIKKQQVTDLLYN